MSTIIHKLGKQAPRIDPRTLKAARYLNALPSPPTSRDWTASVPAWSMMANDRLGDCTCAAAGHMVQAWTAVANPPAVVMTDEQVVTTYSAFTGYTPGMPETDRGGVELSILSNWRNLGLAGIGHKISAFAKVNVHSQREVQQCIALFGGVYVGIALPLSAQEQTGKLWDSPPFFHLGHPASSAPGSWGGHAVPILAYDAKTLTCVTWGALQKMSWEFFNAYCDEAYAIVTPDFIAADGKSPSGFNLDALQADLAAIA